MTPEARLLVAGTLVTSVANFMIAPVLAIWLRREGLPLAEISVIVTTVIVLQQGLTLPAGILVDRVGPRSVIIAALALRVVGYGCFGAAEGILSLLLAGTLVGLGGALFQPASKAMLAAAGPEQRVSSLALRSLALNLGAAVGPLIGALLVSELRLGFAGAAAVYACFLLAYGRTRPAPVQRAVEVASRPRLGEVARDRRALHLLICTAVFWALYSQFTLTVPLFVEEETGTAGAMGIAFALSAVIVIATEYPVVTSLARVAPAGLVMAAGMAVMASAFAALALVAGWAGLVLFVVLFSFAEVLVVAFADLVASDIAPPGRLGTYLGVVSSGWALGALGGNLVGAWVMGRFGAESLWAVCSVTALGGATAFAVADYARRVVAREGVATG